MSPRQTIDPSRQTQPVRAKLAALEDRLDAIERRQRLLKRTLEAVARDAGASIGCPCVQCQRSYLLVRNGGLTCPACGYSESL